MTEWVEETLHGDFATRFRVDRVLYDSQTDHQRLVLFENQTFGRMLVLDNVIQTTERDEFIYHEMLAHLPILAHGAVRRVLIIGGGDGGMLEEVLKHETVEQVTMVEIDASVTDFAKEHLRVICQKAFEDPRTSLVIADGVDFVAACEDRFDLIIIDSTDPIGPGEVLFTESFYISCKACLADGGILVTQNGVPFLQSEELSATMSAFRGLFVDATCYLATVPTYVGGPMAFGWGCDNPALRQPPLETLKVRYAASGIQARYYTPEVHLAAFALPGYIAEMIS